MSSSTTPSSPTPTTSTFSYKGEDYHLYQWNAITAAPRGVIVLYHGFMAHARYPTVRYAAEFLSQQNYAILAADLPGHGESPGLRGYLPGADQVIEYGIAVAQHAKNQMMTGKKGISADTTTTTTTVSCPIFVMGSSLGGNLALHVARHSGPSVVDGGVILMAPMLALNVSPLEQSLLRCLSYVLPTIPLIPSKASSNELQYRDAEKRKECENDPLVVDLGYLRPSSALTCVDLATKVQAEFACIDVPLLILVANEEHVVKNQGSFDLYEKAASVDKTLKRYDALHGLLCEPSPLVDEIQQDILNWLNERTKA